jgi:NAD(P)-dependent dehydrogenase (short-subunit alcohol dehydrogenase family)
MGRAFADRFAKAGMNIVIGDVEQGALDTAVDEIEATGANIVGLRTDVSCEADMLALASRAVADFGRVNVVCLNAGVAGGNGPIETLSAADWQWTLNVNLWGIIHGVGAFLPHLKEHGDGHVVITASIAGRYAYSYDAGPYIASKFATYGLSENLALYLRPQGVDVTVLCPGLVATNLGETARFAGLPTGAGWTHFPEHMQRAISPDDVATMVVDALRTKQFLLYTHPEDEELMRERAVDVDAALRKQIESLPDPTPPA